MVPDAASPVKGCMLGRMFSPVTPTSLPTLETTTRAAGRTEWTARWICGSLVCSQWPWTADIFTGVTTRWRVPVQERCWLGRGSSFLPVGTPRSNPLRTFSGAWQPLAGRSSHANASPFTGTVSAAFAVDGGLDVRATQHLWVRAQGGYLHSSFNTVFPSLQSGAHNEHGRAAVGVVWRF